MSNQSNADRRFLSGGAMAIVRSISCALFSIGVPREVGQFAEDWDETNDVADRQIEYHRRARANRGQASAQRDESLPQARP
jgi:hypothetical protein